LKWCDHDRKAKGNDHFEFFLPLDWPSMKHLLIILVKYKEENTIDFPVVSCRQSWNILSESL
jgi:hypothetical protein